MGLSMSDLRYFAEAARTRNITRAASNLGIRQSSLSQAIQRLEKSMGAPLFMRSKSGISLTRAGATFLAQSKELLQKWEDLGNLTRKSDQAVEGKYSLGCHAALAIHILPAFLPGLFLKFPKVQIDLTHNVSRRITEDVASFRLDFGIVADPRRHPDLVMRRLGTDEAGFFRRAGSAQTSSLPIDDQVLICDPDLHQSQYLSRELEKTRSSFKRHLHTPRLDVIAAIVGAGAGVGILPSRAANLIRGSRLEMIQNLPRMKNTIYLIYRRDALKSVAVREVARYIESHSRWER